MEDLTNSIFPLLILEKEGSLDTRQGKLNYLIKIINESLDELDIDYLLNILNLSPLSDTEYNYILNNIL